MFTIICAEEKKLDPTKFFEKPIKLLDAHYKKPLKTMKAQGCPFIVDFDGDGKMDILLGAKQGMDTSRGGLWVIPNVGTNAKPLLSTAKVTTIKIGGADLNVGCGCKSSGHVLPQAMDWNDDGYTDIVFSDTYQRVWVLINEAKKDVPPTFRKQLFFNMEKKNHGMYAGGGDWNQDGLMDFLHMTYAGGQYKVFKGLKVGKNGHKFLEGGLINSINLKLKGDRSTRAKKCAWAWDFSGTAKKRGVIEYVGINNEAINFYELKDGVSTMIAQLHKPEGRTPLLTVGDMNQDGCMDIVFSCGLWNNQKNLTTIQIMYGKVKNKPLKIAKK